MSCTVTSRLIMNWAMNAGPTRTILVTGASTGIGRAAALALLAEGFRVFAAVRSDQAAEALRKKVPAATAARLETLQLDVTDATQIRSAAERVDAVVGAEGLWGLFNNAGISIAGPLEHIPIERLRRQLEVNVTGQVAVTQAFLPLLRKARGRIVTTGSNSGYFSTPCLAPYCISKYAMEAFSDALRRELRPWGITVSLLEPGAIVTDIWQTSTSEFQEFMRNPPPGMIESYGGLLDRISQAARQSASRAAPVDVVTRDVIHAFMSQRPKTRYRMGPGSVSRKLQSCLPDRWLDSMVAKKLNWG
jgi:NAD(P)-dependent dehydrogenase (short-subunit alcohol dehydrogenase family)